MKRRACNSLESVSGTKDNDVEQLCWLLVDIDPIRPSDTPSTDDELGHAEDCQNRIIKEVFQPTGVEIVKAMSGNGTHTMVPIDYPNDEEYLALQIHPKTWDNEGFNQFELIIEFLITQKVAFITPYEFYLLSEK